MLIAYFDASYNHPSATSPNAALLHTVGGYIGHEDDWRKFRKEWRGELNRKSLSDFHMKEYEHALSQTIRGRELKATNPFHGWKRHDFVPFLRRLHNVLRRKKRNGLARLEGVGCSILKTDFDSMFPDELKDDEGCKSYYMLNVAVNMLHVSGLADHRGSTDEIHYVFAKGDRENGNLKNYFASIWKNDKARKFFRLSQRLTVTGYDLQLADSEPALRAADIAAYEFNKVALNSLDNDCKFDPTVARKSVLNLIREPNNSFPLLLAGARMRRAFASLAAFRGKHGGSFGQINLKRTSESN